MDCVNNIKGERSVVWIFSDEIDGWVVLDLSIVTDVTLSLIFGRSHIGPYDMNVHVSIRGEYNPHIHAGLLTSTCVLAGLVLQKSTAT